mgnify:CR=1 FL=1
MVSAIKIVILVVTREILNIILFLDTMGPESETMQFERTQNGEMCLRNEFTKIKINYLFLIWFESPFTNATIKYYFTVHEIYK